MTGIERQVKACLRGYTHSGTTRLPLEADPDHADLGLGLSKRSPALQKPFFSSGLSLQHTAEHQGSATHFPGVQLPARGVLPLQEPQHPRGVPSTPRSSALRGTACRSPELAHLWGSQPAGPLSSLTCGGHGLWVP